MRDEVQIWEIDEADVLRFVGNRDERHFFLDHLDLKRGIPLFAFRGDAFLGHVFIRLAPAEEPEIREGLPGVPLLQHLRVMDAHQRSGVARRLIGEAERLLYSRGFRQVALAVHPHNHGAISLYRKLSFSAWRKHTLPTFRDHVQDDGGTIRKEEPCLVFVKRLTEPQSS